MSEEPTRHILALEALDRAVHRRGDVDWIHQQLSNSAHFIFVWRECNLFSVGPEKRPLYLKGPGQAIPRNPIFLGIRPNGASFVAADLSARRREEDALTFLALPTDQGCFIPLRQFDGPLSAEDRALLFYSRSLTHWQGE